MEDKDSCGYMCKKIYKKCTKDKKKTEIDPDMKVKMKINILTLCCKVSTLLGDPDCVKFLDSYLEACDNHLQIQQIALYVEVLWDNYWTVIILYRMVGIVQFLVLGFTVLFGPVSTVMWIINTTLAALLLLNETRQMIH